MVHSIPVIKYYEFNMRNWCTALLFGLGAMCLSLEAYASIDVSADINHILKLKTNFHYSNPNKLSGLYAKNAMIKFKIIYSNRQSRSKLLHANVKLPGQPTKSIFSSYIDRSNLMIKFENIRMVREKNKTLLFADVYFPHNCFHFPGYQLQFVKDGNAFKIFHEVFGYSEANFCNEELRSGQLNKKNALRIFRHSRALWDKYDPKVSHYYSESVNFIVRKDQGYGRYLKTTHKSSLVPYKDRLKFIMQGYKSQRNKSKYFNVYTSRNNKVIKIEAHRRDISNCFDDRGFYVIIAKTQHGLQIIEEQITKADRSYCAQSEFGFGPSHEANKSESFIKAGLQDILDQ